MYRLEQKKSKIVSVFDSSNSKLVTHSIVSSFVNDLNKWCAHRLRRSFDDQVIVTFEIWCVRVQVSVFADIGLNVAKQGAYINRLKSRDFAENKSASL